jgi:hypothetical protein
MNPVSTPLPHLPIDTVTRRVNPVEIHTSYERDESIVGW